MNLQPCRHGMLLRAKRGGLPAGRQGFTLIEVVVYVAIFVVIATVATLFFLGTFRAAGRTRGEQIAVANAALALRAMELEVRHADAIYTPTSLFDDDAGQLSLRAPRGAPTDHLFAYVDFYLDNGVLYLRRDDGAGPIALTSGDVRVTAYRVERFVSGNAEGVRMAVTADPAGIAAPLAQPKTLRTFAVPRSFSP